MLAVPVAPALFSKDVPLARINRASEYSVSQHKIPYLMCSFSSLLGLPFPCYSLSERSGLGTRMKVVHFCLVRRGVGTLMSKEVPLQLNVPALVFINDHVVTLQRRTSELHFLS